MDLFPIMVKLKSKRCVVVGAGEIAASKITGLLAAGAQVTAIAPRACAAIEQQAREGKLLWHSREFVPSDIAGAFLVVAATDSASVNEAVFAACTDRGVLCNVVDDPEHCDFFYPAVVHRGALQIAVSTGGRSPALARRLRQELEQQFGPEYGEWVEQVGRARREILARDMPAVERRQLLEQIASRKAYEEFVRGRVSAAGDSLRPVSGRGAPVKSARRTNKS